MIRYSLRCDREHLFDSWFGSSADFDRLTAAGLVACAVCDLSLSRRTSWRRTSRPRPRPEPAGPGFAGREALAEFRRHVEATSENVGRDFAAEARRIHEGVSAERPIIGEARPAEARALVEDGIPVAPLPWGNRRTS